MALVADGRRPARSSPALLASGRSQLTLATDLLLFLVATVAIAVVGGTGRSAWSPPSAPSLLGELVSRRAPRTPSPSASRRTSSRWSIFVLAAVAASILVDRIATRSREALQARAEAEALARTSSILIGEPNPLPGPARPPPHELRAGGGVAPVRTATTAGSSTPAPARTRRPSRSKASAGTSTRDGSSVLVLRGAKLSADDQRVLRTFLSNLALALQSRRLQAEAAMAAHLAEADELRTALLQAVSHDLRTPLATIKASATSLLQSDVSWDVDQRREFAQTIDDEADRLNRLVGNLLDMSRLHAGAVSVLCGRCTWRTSSPPPWRRSSTTPPASSSPCPRRCPPVHADPALLERALANIVANALAWSPPARRCAVEGAEVAGRVHLRVIDRGPGVLPADRDKVFQPFQRLGDRSTQAGVGLGLAVARGFVEAVGGSIELDDTPGGGLTVVVDLPRRRSRADGEPMPSRSRSRRRRSA